MVIIVLDEEVIRTTRRLANKEVLVVGTSSGENVAVAKELDSGRRNVITVLPDRVRRYFSTALI